MKPFGWMTQCVIRAFQVIVVTFLVPCGKIPGKKQLKGGRTCLGSHSEGTGHLGGESMVAEWLLLWQLGFEASGHTVCTDREWREMKLVLSSLSYSLLCQGTAHIQCGSPLLS